MGRGRASPHYCKDFTCLKQLSRIYYSWEAIVNPSVKISNGTGNKRRHGLTHTVSRMLIEGYSKEEIAASLGLTSSQAREVSNRVYRDFIREQGGFADQAALALERLRLVAQEALAAWERSQQPSQVHKRKFDVVQLEPPSGDLFDECGEKRKPESMKLLVEETTEERGRDGNVAFLSEFRSVAETILKMCEKRTENLFTAEQMVAAMNAAVRAVERRVTDVTVVQGVKEEILSLLSQVNTIEPTGGLRETPSPAVVESDASARASDSDGTDVSAVDDTAEPPDRPCIDPVGYDEEAG